MGAKEGLVGVRECLRDIGEGGALWYSVHTLRGGSLLAKWTVPSSVFRYWVGSNGRGGNGGRSGREDGFNGSGCLRVDRVTRRGSDEDEKNWGGS